MHAPKIAPSGSAAGHARRRSVAAVLTGRARVTFAGPDEAKAASEDPDAARKQQQTRNSGTSTAAAALPAWSRGPRPGR